MASPIPPPTITLDDHWVLTTTRSATPFDIKFLTVKTRTQIYEDTRCHVKSDSTQSDQLRFIFVTRVRFSPETSVRSALTQLVRRKSAQQFQDILQTRGVERISERNARQIFIGDYQLTFDRLRGRLQVNDSTVIPVESLFGVRPFETEYLLCGSGYPLSLPGNNSAHQEQYREEFFEAVRSAH